MAQSKDLSLLLNKYLSIYKINPHSKVFAPLSLIYLKLGFNQQAMDILKRGLSEHPNYVLGHYALSCCHVNEGKFSVAYKILRPLVSQNSDNFLLLNLFGEVCQKLAKDNEALESFKYLLFLRPKDKLIQQKVKLLEENFDVLRNELTQDEFVVENHSPSRQFKLVTELGENNSKRVINEETNREKSENREIDKYSLDLVNSYLTLNEVSAAKDILNEMINLDPSDFALKLKEKEINEKNKLPVKINAKNHNIYYLFLEKIRIKSKEQIQINSL
jgi:tetratricopeptide (TPR) repeat protein